MSNKVIGILKEIEGGISNIPESGISPLLRDLLQKMLMFEESDRITVEQALQHPYLEEEIKKLQEEIANEDITY